MEPYSNDDFSAIPSVPKEPSSVPTEVVDQLPPPPMNSPSIVETPTEKSTSYDNAIDFVDQHKMTIFVLVGALVAYKYFNKNEKVMDSGSFHRSS